MMRLSRRWFILGSTAAIASAKLTLPELFPDAPALFAPLDIEKPLGVRSVYRVDLSNGDLGPAHYSFTRNGDEARRLLSFSVARGGMLSWWAVPGGGEIYLPGNDTLRIVAHPDPGGDARMAINWDTADGVSMWTHYVFRDGVATPTATASVYA